uniref:Protein S100 n=1 Tax=Leptobrachium leishanense TaxID=445787 RepID=A0A8C5Q1U4_9ANUR
MVPAESHIGRGFQKHVMSGVQKAMILLMEAYFKYTRREGKKYTLTKGELKELLQKELGDFIANSKDPKVIDKIMNDLDSNKDGQVDFTEYVALLGAVTITCRDFFNGTKAN